jgi:hypothetical protein
MPPGTVWSLTEFNLKRAKSWEKQKCQAFAAFLGVRGIPRKGCCGVLHSNNKFGWSPSGICPPTRERGTRKHIHESDVPAANLSRQESPQQ